MNEKLYCIRLRSGFISKHAVQKFTKTVNAIWALCTTWESSCYSSKSNRLVALVRTSVVVTNNNTIN